MPSPLVYNAGSYTAPDADGRERNVFASLCVTHQLLAMGAAVVDSRASYHRLHGELPEQCFIDSGLALLGRCDALVVSGDWRSSKGTLAEMAEAKRLRLPCFNWTIPGERDALRVWIEDYQGSVVA